MRVLGCLESTHISTGYANMGRQLFRRLAADGRFELLELANFGTHAAYAPGWAYLPTSPRPGDRDEERKFNSSPFNRFGAWKFEEACLQFRPDACLSFLDPWMVAHVDSSPFRRRFGFAYQPTVDAVPLAPDWVALARGSDRLLCYTDWGKAVLSRHGLDAALAAPGVDGDAFRPLDRAALRRRYGVPQDALVVGAVMRNQVRKLFPELFVAFSRLLRDGPEAVASRSRLLLHTCWPDLGWDLPSLIRENGLHGRVLITYGCRSCGAFAALPWRDARAVCPGCGSHALTFPSSMEGVDERSLCEAYNLMDIFAQVASAEGLGLPQLEAAACGTPVLAVDYSGMVDVLEKLGATPIPVVHFSRDVMTNRLMAVPDVTALAGSLAELLRLPGPTRLAMGLSQRARAVKHFDWDRFAAAWKDALLSLPGGDWASPRRRPGPFPGRPADLADEVRRCVWELAGRPELADSYQAEVALRDLTWGRSHARGSLSLGAFLKNDTRPTPFTMEQAREAWEEHGRWVEAWEAKRAEVCR